MTSSRWTVVILAFAAACGTASAPPEATAPLAPAPGPAAAPARSAAATSAPLPPLASATAKAPPPAPPAKASAAPAPAVKASTPAAPAAKAASPSAGAAAGPAAPKALDLKSLEKRLKDTNAIGLMTKLSLKNQLDDLVAKFRAFHDGRRPPTLTELRPGFELMLMKVLSLVQDQDSALANDINAARGAMWEVLSDREKFTKAL